MKRLPPLWRGVVVIALLQLLLAVALSFYLLRNVPDPQPDFLGDLADIGATLFVAFVIEMSADILAWTPPTLSPVAA